MMALRRCRIFVHSKPDGHGRQRFTMEWTDRGGVYRHERGPDGHPVGYRRGQVFNAVLKDHARRGCRVIAAPESSARRRRRRR